MKALQTLWLKTLDGQASQFVYVPTQELYVGNQKGVFLLVKRKRNKKKLVKISPHSEHFVVLIALAYPRESYSQYRIQISPTLQSNFVMQRAITNE